MNNIEQALNDIAFIKNVIQKNNDSILSGITLQAHLLIQIMALVMALVLVGLEYFTQSSLTDTLMMGNLDVGVKNIGITLIGAILLGLTCSLYFVLWRAAQHSGENLNNYIQRHFKYINNTAFLSDLLMKFITVALILLAGKAQWIAPLLVAFTADYLLQARFFTITTKVSSVLGILFILVAGIMFFMEISTIIIPLVGFSLVCAISVSRLVMRFKELREVNKKEVL